MIIPVNYQSWMCFQPCKSDKSRQWLPTNHRITIDMGEIDEFPIAFTVKDERIVIMPGEDELSACMRPISTPYRTDEGKLFVPFYEKVAGLEKRTDVNYVTFKRFIEGYIAEKFTGDKKDETRLFQPGESIIIKEDNDDEIQDFLRRKFAEFRYYNHSFWIETTEPRYFVQTYGSRKRNYFETSIVIRNTFGLNNPRERFSSASDLKGAQAFYDKEVANGSHPVPVKVHIYVKMKDMVKVTSGTATDITIQADESGQYSFAFDKAT